MRVSGNISWTLSHPGALMLRKFICSFIIFFFSFLVLCLFLAYISLCFSFYAISTFSIFRSMPVNTLLFYSNYLLLYIFALFSLSIVLHCFTLFFSFDSGETDGIIFSNTPLSHLTLFSLPLFNFICYPLYYVSLVLCFYCFLLIVYCSFVLLIIYALYVSG